MTATIAQQVTIGAVTLHPTAAKLRQITMELKQQFQERDEAIECLVLALLTNEGVFMLGDPGTGKSLLCRTFYRRIIDAIYFEKALAGDTPPESLIGAPDFVKLVNESAFVRNTKGTLIEATHAMLDEFGRANGIVTDVCLPILNERVFHEVDPVTGESVRPIPLRSFAGGSNSLPTEENEGAAAFFDRLLLRVVVSRIKLRANYIAMLRNGARPVPNPTTITLAENIEAADVLVPAVALPDDVLVAMADLRDELARKYIDVSDRRHNQCLKLVQASAFLRGATVASTTDISVLKYALWSDPEQAPEVRKMSLTVSNPLGSVIVDLSDKVAEIVNEVNKIKANTAVPKGKRSEEFTKQAGLCGAVQIDLDAALTEARDKGYNTTELDEVGIQLAAAKKHVMDVAMADMASQLG